MFNMFLITSICVFGLFSLASSEISSGFHHEELASSRQKRSIQTEGSSYVFYQQTEYPKDCKEIFDECEDQSADGIYLIKPEGASEPFDVYCNNTIDGGGWTVFQRRLDGSVDFYRNWNSYKRGFGFLRREFWLGNDKLSLLTNQKNYELRIDLNNVNGQPYFAKYNLFRISDEGSKYRLVGLGNYDSTSTANSNAMDYHRNQSFSTLDRDNDLSSSDHCATNRHGAWWFHGAGRSNCRTTGLNALYNAGSTNTKNIYWNNLPGDAHHIKYTEMKIRPLPGS